MKAASRVLLAVLYAAVLLWAGLPPVAPAGSIIPPEVPVIPEGESLLLLVTSLAFLGGLVALRRRR